MEIIRKNNMHCGQLLKLLLLITITIVALVVLSVRMPKYGVDFAPVLLFHNRTRIATHLEVHLGHIGNRTSIPKNRSGSIMDNGTTLERSLNLTNINSDQSKNEMVFHKMSECFKSTPNEKNRTELHFHNESSNYKFECKHLMYLGYHNYGRTGNQLFQAASLLGIASYHGYTALLNSSMSIAEIFHLPNLRLTKFENVRHVGETGCCRYDNRVELLDHATNWTLRGFFQSWRYFKGIDDVVRREFIVKEKFANEAKNFINATVSPKTINVCIHVRRGDFLHLHEAGFNAAPVGFIQNATNYFRKKYEPVHFFVVSDDKAWCETNLKWPNVTMSPFSTVGHDMALMIESDHMIITSGTFGWWGAWLAGGETVFWTGFTSNKTSWLGKQFNDTDFYPGHWIGLS